MVRLNKYLADCGIAARRKCDELILAGEVSINGVIERRLGVRVNEETDQIMFRNCLVSPVVDEEYIALNKPRGVLTTASDDRGRKTVIDLVRVRSRIFPVGRLDRDTSGLLLLTNDGDLAYRIAHPKFEIKKKYRVHLDEDLLEKDKKRLEHGVTLSEGITSPCSIRFLRPNDRTYIEMTIHQGLNRQIRRMFETIGQKVKSLHRTQVGTLRLNGIRAGEWRRLDSPEVKALRRIIYGD